MLRANKLASAFTALAVAFSSVLASIALGALPANAAACAPNVNFASGTYTLKFTTVGNCTWKAPAGVNQVEMLIVAGGGAGGAGTQAGGGGGGEVLYNSNYTLPTQPVNGYQVVVGAGGLKATTAPKAGGKGGSSSFGTVVAIGGGYGGGGLPQTTGVLVVGGNGGSGGGSSILNTVSTGASVGTDHTADGFTAYRNVGGKGVSNARTGFAPTYGAGAGGGGAMSAATDSALASNVVTLGRAGAGLSILGLCVGGGGDSSYLTPTEPGVTNASANLLPSSPVACKTSAGSTVSGTQSGGYANTAPVVNSGGGSAAADSSYYDGAAGIIVIRWSVQKPTISYTKTGSSTDGKPVVSGATVPGYKVRVSALGATWETIADANGDWSVHLGVDAEKTGSFDASSYSVYYEVKVVSLDELGNVSDANTLNIKNVVVEDVTDVSPQSGVSSGGRTYFKDNTPGVRFTGLRVGNAVTVTATKSGTGDVVTGNYTATASAQTFTMPTLSDGTWTIVASHTDSSPTLTRAAAPSSVIVIDTSAPAMPVLSNNWAGGSASTVAFTFTGEANAAFTCNFDGSSTACTSPATYSSLAPGSHSFTVLQKDIAGNSSVAASYAFTIEPNLPTDIKLTLASDTGVSATDGFTADTTPTVTSSSLILGAKLSIKAQPVIVSYPDPRSSVYCEVTVTATTQECTFSELAEGDWQFSATQSYPAENTSAAALGQKINIDAQAPAPPSIGPDLPGVWDKTFTFNIYSPDSVRFECRLDGVILPCTRTLVLTNLKAGDHELRIVGYDIEGNVTQATVKTFTTNEGTSPQPTASETPTAEPSPSPEPSPSEEGGFGDPVANPAIGATGDDNAPPQEFDPLASEEGVKAVAQTATKAITLVSSVAAAAAGAAAAGAAAGAAGASAGASSSSAGGSSAGGSSSSGGSSSGANADTSNPDANEMEQMEIRQDNLTLENSGAGDRLAFAMAGWYAILDRPSHELSEKAPRYSPLLAKIFNDGAYVRAVLGPFSLLLPIMGIWLGFASIGSDAFGVLTPNWFLMLLMALLGIFDAFAGFIAGLIFVIGSVITAGHPIEANEWRLLVGAMLICIGPSLLTTTFRKLRKAHAEDNDGWWERFADLGIAPFMASWVTGSMVASMPALAGVTLPIANHVADFQIALGIAIFARVWFEEATARVFPFRLNRINPDEIFEPPLYQRYISLSLKFVAWVFVSGALVGFTWHVFVGAFLTLAPTIATWYEDKYPNSPLLWKILPTGLPGLALKLSIASVTTLIATMIFGASPELASMSFVLLPIPMLVLDVLGLFGRHGNEENEERPIKQYRWLYRIGGIVMFAIVLKLAGVY